ncbi:helix-turn-helix transcriptional regulator [Methanosphaera sp. WGK6]|uniref:helix-turn-helix transcriptional regulator n=1 Tax=Methanosphaera sp. WGK6 TaxID=1561964 RepID=UPI00084BEA99|nr:helix-turn-helix transcriptional regulator [Methanosphaera sp. WGK6]OED29554.1 transcriptional regulator [Methanosphaera sp. WGK6]
MKTNISYLRKALNLSQQELADKTGVTRQTINVLENGRYNPSLMVAYKITKILECKHIEDVFILDENEDNED